MTISIAKPFVYTELNFSDPEAVKFNESTRKISIFTTKSIVETRTIRVIAYVITNDKV
jgi:hypothetical protein